jgi:hypothetical protein
LTPQYRTDLQAVHFFNLMSSHSLMPQDAQKDDESASSLIFLRNIVSRPLSKMRQQRLAAQKFLPTSKGSGKSSQ